MYHLATTGGGEDCLSIDFNEYTLLILMVEPRIKAPMNY